MFKAKRRRPVFLSAAILAILLGSVLIGSTFASGVDYNTDEKGDPGSNYNVAFEYLNGTNGYVTLENARVLTESMLWCPGKTEIIYLKLENSEAFATSCTLTLDVTETGFGDTLTYAIYDGDLKALNNPPKNWSDFKYLARDLKDQNEKTVKDLVLSEASHVLLEKELLDHATGSKTRYLALAIHMDENASSDYANKRMEFDLRLQIDANYQPGQTDLSNPQ